MTILLTSNALDGLHVLIVDSTPPASYNKLDMMTTKIKLKNMNAIFVIYVPSVIRLIAVGSSKFDSD